MMETISPTPSSLGSSNTGDEDSAPIVASSSRASSPEPSNRIDVPLENDVLCGRGGSINSHKGNEQFRSLVEKRKRVYLTARFKREKRLIASSIVTEIRGMNPPGKFLARKGSKDSGYWYDIGDEKARDKTSQALRENAPSIRAEIETEINQQREEMRRQEETSTQRSSSNNLKIPSQSPYPPPPSAPHGHHQHSYQNYAQQYYDYYYHYYGYSAPPPPPPPGYTGGAPPPPPPGYPPAPAPYWASQEPNVASKTRNGEEYKEEEGEANASNGSSVPSSGSAAAMPPPPPQIPLQNHQPPPNSQEEQDHRMAMALQQQENAKAFEDRNRRFGSDRRSSRSTAFCAPGYRPRLLNDRFLDEQPSPGTPSRKRPAMSASQYFAGNNRRASAAHSQSSSSLPSVASTAQSQNQGSLKQEELDHRMAVALQNEEDNAIHYQIEASGDASRRTSRSNAHFPVRRGSLTQKFGFESIVPSGLMAWTRGGHPNSASAMNGSKTNSDADMDCKPAATENDPLMKPLQDDYDHQHNHDHSLSSMHSYSSRGKAVQFKDDSDMISLFGEGGPVIPPPNSTGSHRVRDASSNFNPIALDESPNSLSQFQRRENSKRQHHQDHDSSLLSQVATHILGTFGSSWTESDVGASGRGTHQNGHNPSRNVPADHPGNEMDAEMGQEVVMDVRDESSMPPPEPRGAEVQIDWPSRAGCHSWIPETFGANASAFFGNHVEDDKHLIADHSLMRQNSYNRSDISPVNSLDMELSQSSLGGGRRRGKKGGLNSSLMRLFEQKTEEPAAEENIPSFHQSVINQVPSWERSFRNRSPTVSLGELCADDEDDSLIRVDSYDIKDKFFAMTASNNMPEMHQYQNHSSSQMPPPTPVHHHHHHHQGTSTQHGHLLDESDDMDMGMDWEDHAGE